MTLRIDRASISEDDALMLDDALARAVTRRERNLAANRCINDNLRGTHGPATEGCRCKRCVLVHKYGAEEARQMPEYKLARPEVNS